jgi:hypothetical protein
MAFSKVIVPVLCPRHEDRWSSGFLTSCGNIVTWSHIVALFATGLCLNLGPENLLGSP